MLRYTGLTLSNQPFAQILSGSFSVAMGDPYKLVFSRFLGNAFGGEYFSSTPVIGVADRGGNIVTSVNSGSVFANLTTNPTDAILRPPAATTAPIVDGLADFQSLFINEAAVAYRITFSTNLLVR